MVAAAMLPVATVISLTSYVFTRSIGKLTIAMKEIKKGGFEIQVVNRGRDEIGWFMESLNLMVSRIDHLVRKVY